jgi:hypothetical protein
MEMSRKWTKRSGKWLAGAALLTATGAAGVGCLARPVGTQPPTTKVNFTSTVSQQSVDKVDLLFMIDNSASMGDKQTILADAVPNLLVGLLQPKCVDPGTGNPPAGVTQTADPKGRKPDYGCPMGTEPEFAPVTDMHIGIISSSLGSYGGDVCADGGRQNDRGHLLNIAGTAPLPEASPSNFLAWYPQNDANTDKMRHPDPPVTPFGDVPTLSTAFGKLVTGIGQTGCGLESQLESWYHFLVQPDPWVKVTVDATNKADLGTDIDVDLLTQRADFLRPDSLVAVILLTDEDDSGVDPLAVGGQGWAFHANQFPGSPNFRKDGKTTTAPRGTTICDKDPGSPDCTSCGFAATCNPSDPSCQKIKNDPNCMKTGGYYGAEEDQLNSRYSQQLVKRNYGIDPQYPLSRYTDGLSKTKVPDRTTEHLVKVNGANRDIGGYLGTGKCTNPLFAAKLPRGQGEDFCNLPRGTRTPDLVFFAVVGGVPNTLLHFDATDAEKSRITNDDWTKILGQDPAHYNYTGLDVHMIESKEARAGLPPPSATRGDLGTDPINGREWDTAGNDLQYACTFALPQPRTCTAQDTSCDCATAGTNPPLCGATIGQQVKAKAYPTVREFMVVHALGDQGVIASLCPLSLTVPKTDPTYGYNPAVKAIIDRLKNALTTQCLPQQLTRDTTNNEVPCLVLAQLGLESDSCQKAGLDLPAPEILQKFLEAQKAASGDPKDGGVDLSKLPVCQLPQLTVPAGQTCKDNPKEGWCYVENSSSASPAGRCPQALIFSGATSALSGAKFSLQCIQQFSPGQAAGIDAGP